MARSGKGIYLLIACMLSMVTLSGYAQQAVLMGRVVDAGGNPVPGAVIKLYGEKKATAVADELGLLTSEKVPDGTYRVRVEYDRRKLRCDKITLSSSTTDKYYVFLIDRGKKVSASYSSENPYMQARLSKIERDEERIDMGMRGRHRNYNSPLLESVIYNIVFGKIKYVQVAK